MKKHRRFQHVEKKEEKSRAGLYLAIFLAVIMVGGAAGILLSNPTSPNDITFGSYSFKNVNNKWVTTINKQELSFYFSPDQAQTVPVQHGVTQAIKNADFIILSFNPNQNTTERLQGIDVFRFEAVNALFAAGKNKLAFGVTQKTPLYNLTVLTCQNASITTPVISVDYSNETSIKLQNSCVVVSALTEFDLLEALDALRYHILGVLNENQ